MAKGKEVQTLDIDGKSYELDDLSDEAKAQIVNIQFVDNQLQQLQNELAVSDTARIGYTNALKRELSNKEKQHPMADKIKIGDNEYSADDFSETGKVHLASITFTIEKLQELNNMQALLQRAKNSYVDSLKKEVLAAKSGFIIE